MEDSATEATGRQAPPPPGLLAGLRIADFCWAGVGAIATRMLADFGAEVIKIEDRRRLDLTRRMPIYKGQAARAISNEDAEPDPNKSGHFNNYNRNKLSFTINMSKPAGREVAERLIRKSQALTENFAPGVMEKWGLTYERVKELQPEIIYARMSGFGHDGPNSHFRSYGPIVQAVSGLSFISGLPGREPSGWGLSYMDNQAAYYNACSILVAHFARLRTGRGTLIDSSASEVGIGLIGPALLDATVNSRPTRRTGYPPGNRSLYRRGAPHGVYPAAGADRWIAITVFSDEEWVALTDVIGDDSLRADARFTDAASRFAHQDEIDAVLAKWTASRDPVIMTKELQAAGVQAGTVQNAEDLLDHDPQVRARDVYFTLDHPVVGPAEFEGVPVRMSRTQPTLWRSAPLLGEDNDYVLRDVMGLTDAEIQDYSEAGAF